MKRKVALLLLAVFMGTGAIEPSLVSFGAEIQEEEEFSAKRMKPEEGPDDLVLSEELNQTERLGQGEDLEQTKTISDSAVMELSEEKAASPTVITIGANGYEANRAGFQKAFDFIQEQNKKGNQAIYTVSVPAGTYSIDAPLYLYSNTHLALAPGAVMKNTGIGTSLLRLGRDGEIYSGTSGFRNITIEGGTWTAEFRDGSSLLRMAHGKNIVIKNAVFQDVKNEHHIEAAGIDGFTVTGCTFSGYVKTIESDELLMEALEIDIMGGEKFFPGYEKYDYTPMTNVTVSNNVFKNLFRGVGTHSLVRGSYFENIKVQNNRFENIADYAVLATNYRNSSIAGNTMVNVGAGIYFCNVQTLGRMVTPTPALKFNTDSQSRIEKNTITLKAVNQTVNRCGIRAEGDEGNYIIRSLTITGNTINASTGGHGILGSYIKDCTISGNAVTGKNTLSKAYKGIRLTYSANVPISGNTVKNMSDHGITVTDKSQSCPISKNNVSGSKGAGIIVTEGSKGCSISGNQISSNKKNGIFVSGGGSSGISGNRVSSNKGTGISVSGSSTPVAVSKNTVEKNSKYGISIGKGTGYSVADNGKISENGRHGIYFSGCSNVEAVRNKVTSNKKSGIVMSKVTGGRVESNSSVSSNKESGIILTGVTGGKVSSNAGISSNQENGITISKSSDIEISGNQKIKSNKRMGISVTGKSVKNIVISGNKISSSGIHGLAVSGASTVQAAGNSIGSNKKYGVSISEKSAKCQITGNTINKNKKGGVLIAGKCSSNQVAKNTVKYNKGHGIAVSDSNKTKITENAAVSHNQGHGILINSKSNHAEISKNIVSVNKEHGIMLYDKSLKAKIMENTLRKNGKNGIYICGKSRASVLKKNDFTSNKGLNIQIEAGSKAPVKDMGHLTVGSLTSKVTELVGKGTKDFKIIVKAKEKNIGRGTVNKDETYSIKIKKQKKGTVVTVIMMDKQKNQMEKEIKVK
ncbi:MAG: hypothetical protein HFH50_03255 [Lachnospiraceae bacterium]|jgi:parallel beta-helix repeat protein|nr:hypothetical protein [Lachnospiraceae bacterium]